MIVTLAAFIGGSLIGTAHMPFWTSLPQLAPVSLVKSLGVAPALALNWLVYAPVIEDVTSVMDTGLRPWFGLEVERVQPAAC